MVSLLTEIRIGTGKNNCWTGARTANIPAVMAAAAAASGENFILTEAISLEVLSTGVTSAAVKSKFAGEISGMRRLYNTIGGLQSGAQTGFGIGIGLQRLRSGVSPQPPVEDFNAILLQKFVHLLQQFVNVAEKGGTVEKASFREACSQATALLLSNLVRLFMVHLSFPDTDCLCVEVVLTSILVNFLYRALMQKQMRSTFRNYYAFYAGVLLIYAPLMLWKLQYLCGLGWFLLHRS